MRVIIYILLFVSLSGKAWSQVEDFTHIDFRKADSVARAYNGYELDNLVTLSHKLTSPLSTDVEKFRAIYTWVCLNIKNDYVLHQQNQNARKRLKDPKALEKWNKDVTKTAFQKLLKNKSTVCTGYAYLLRELSFYAGIRSVMVDGYGRTVAANVGGPGLINHSWNAVQLNGKWYLCDPTWSSGAVDMELKVFVPNYNEAYFLLDPHVFVRNHYPVDSTFLFLPEKPTLHEFLNRPLIYSYFVDYKFTHLSPETFEIEALRNQPIRFELTGGKRSVESIQVQVKDMTTTITPFQTGSTLAFSHTFTAKGSYILHIKLDGNFAVTYKVSVK